MEFLILYGEFLWNRNFMVSDLIENLGGEIETN